MYRHGNDLTAPPPAGFGNQGTTHIMDKAQPEYGQNPAPPGIPAPASSEIKLTLVGRTLFQFESYLFGDNLRKYFATHDFLNGLATEKKDATGRMNLALGRSIILSFVLLCYVSGVRFDVELFNVKILQFPAIIEVLTFLTAFSLFATVIAFLDFIIVDRILAHLSGTILGIDSPIYGYAHRNSYGIWADIFTIRHVGYQSSFAHRIIVIIFLAYFFVYGATYFALVTGTITYAFYFIVIEENKTSWMFTAMSWMGLVVAVVGVFIFAVALLVRFKFKIPKEVSAAIEREKAAKAKDFDA